MFVKNYTLLYKEKDEVLRAFYLHADRKVTNRGRAFYLSGGGFYHYYPNRACIIAVVREPTITPMTIVRMSFLRQMTME